MAITNDVDRALLWHQAGVQRLMVDLERHGKAERQGGRDTVRSEHVVEDVTRLRAVLPEAHLVARCEPMDLPSWDRHVESVVDAGPTSLMIPMIRRADEVATVRKVVDGRAALIVMIETSDALRDVEAIAAELGSGTLFVGLNDLHVELGHRFMFEPLARGHVAEVAEVADRHGLRFGFGGLARIGTGQVDPGAVVGEHVRLGSDLAILARSFFAALDDPDSVDEVAAGIDELRAAERAHAGRSTVEQVEHADAIRRQIDAVATRMAGHG